ncbi:MAG TPA: sialidase family protein [archaeon]|nr:sialidase family protein [archaeon]
MASSSNTWLCLLITGLSLICPVRSQAEERPFFQESFVFKGSDLIPECYRPTLLCLPDSTLACAWAEGSGQTALDLSVKVSFKPAGESEWIQPVTAADDVGYPDSYPVLALLPGNRIRLFYATCYREKRKAPPGASLASWHLKYRDSNDAGYSWGTEFFLVPESDRVPCGRVVSLSNGDLILPVTDIRRSASLFILSRDKGAYWKDLAGLTDPSGLADPSVVELEPGRLLAMLRPHETGEREHFLWSAESGDNGLTWSAPQQTGLNNPCSLAALLILGNGHLVLAFNDHELWCTPLTLALSTDWGKSWQFKRNLESGQWDNRDPSLVETDDGHIHVVYVSRNIYLKHIEVTESWITENQ